MQVHSFTKKLCFLLVCVDKMSRMYKFLFTLQQISQFYFSAIPQRGDRVEHEAQHELSAGRVGARDRNGADQRAASGRRGEPGRRRQRKRRRRRHAVSVHHQVRAPQEGQEHQRPVEVPRQHRRRTLADAAHRTLHVSFLLVF